MAVSVNFSGHVMTPISKTHDGCNSVCALREMDGPHDPCHQDQLLARHFGSSEPVTHIDDETSNEDRPAEQQIIPDSNLLCAVLLTRRRAVRWRAVYQRREDELSER